MINSVILRLFYGLGHDTGVLQSYFPRISPGLETRFLVDRGATVTMHVVLDSSRSLRMNGIGSDESSG